MAYTFVNITNQTSRQTYWACLLENRRQVDEYLQVFSLQFTKEFKKVKEAIEKGYHLHGGLVSLTDAYILGSMPAKDDVELKKNRLTILNEGILDQELTRVKGNVADTMTSAVLAGRKVIVNKVGGYCFLTKDYTLHKTVKSEDYVFPEYSEKDISISQWDGGTHYYAKVGNFDVKIEGKTKWATHSEAEANAKRYLIGLNAGFWY